MKLQGGPISISGSGFGQGRLAAYAWRSAATTILDSFMEPATDARGELLPAHLPAYASFTARLRALLADAVVVLGGILLVLTLAALTTAVPGSGRIALVGLVTLGFLYEPLLVWRLGGTIGHRRANLRVVHEATGRNPGLLRAIARFLLKSGLGLLSFASMALTRRHQAMHDGLTGTTVQVRDLTRAQPGDVRWEREVPGPVGLPSRTRRVAVILGYMALAFVAFTVASNPLFSDACFESDRCTAGEELASWVVSLGWTGASAWFIVAGWRGRLWGCRPRQGGGQLSAPAA